MYLSAPSLAVSLIGVLHVFFMIGELFPWNRPIIMVAVLRKWPQKLDLSANDTNFVATVVHNAGIYNGIVAAALFMTVAVGQTSYWVQVTLLAGGVVAGLFGAFTLTKATAIQAILGAIALCILISSRG